MTRRERYMAVINGEITPELIEEFKAEIEKMDKVNKERKETITPHQMENEEIKGAIKAFFEIEVGSHFIEEIVEVAKEVDEGITRQRTSSLCKQLVDEGFLSVEDVRVKNKGLRKLYTRV